MNVAASLPVTDRPLNRSHRRLSLSDGATVSVTGEGTLLQVRSVDGTLVLEYDASVSKARLALPGGAEAATCGGDLRVAAAGRLTLAGESVSVEGRQAVGLQVGRDGVPGTQLRLEGPLMRAVARALRIDTERAQVAAGDTTLEGKTLHTELDEAHLRIGRVERIAETVIDRAGDLFRFVAGVEQVAAGRLRQIVQKTFSLEARDATVTADQDFRVRAEQINLG